MRKRIAADSNGPPPVLCISCETTHVRVITLTVSDTCSYPLSNRAKNINMRRDAHFRSSSTHSYSLLTLRMRGLLPLSLWKAHRVFKALRTRRSFQFSETSAHTTLERLRQPLSAIPDALGRSWAGVQLAPELLTRWKDHLCYAVRLIQSFPSLS